MNGNVLAEKVENIQSWVSGWGIGGAANPAHGGAGGKNSADSEHVDWESLLRKQNAANDELCSENGRLRADVERLRSEERAADARQDKPGGDESAAEESCEETFEDQLSHVVLEALRQGFADCFAREQQIGERQQQQPQPQSQSSQTPASAEDQPVPHTQQCELEAFPPSVPEQEVLPELAPSAIDVATHLLEAMRLGALENIMFSLEEDTVLEFAQTRTPASPASVEPAHRGTQASAEAAGVDACDPSCNGPRDVCRSNCDEGVAAGFSSADASTTDESNIHDIIDAQTLPSQPTSFALLCSNTADAQRAARASWQADMERAVADAVRAAVKEEADASAAAPALNAADETAVLVGEKIALRELVEKQQERIENLEKELGEAGATTGGGGLVADALRQRLSDAGGQLSANVREGLSAVLAPPAKAAKIAVVGAEYEVVGRSGAIVREGESLRSEQITSLPPGSRVRIVSVSDNYPRRVEIVCAMMPVSSPAQTLPGHVSPVAEVPEHATQDMHGQDRPGASAKVAEESAAATGMSVTLQGGDSTEGAEHCVPAESSPSDTTSLLPSQSAGDGAADIGSVPLTAPVVGWISACSKDGRMLIRPMATESSSPGDGDEEVAGGSVSGDAVEPDAREEGVEEVRSVTLSTMEWECLHQDSENSTRRVEALTNQLNSLGAGLLQSFEMRSVLGELQLGVSRAEERLARMRETAKMAEQELEQRRHEWKRRRRRPSFFPAVEGADLVAAPAEGDVTAGGSSSSSSAFGAEKQPIVVDGPCGGDEAIGSVTAKIEASTPSGGQACEGVDAVDWTRLVSERESTAAALSVALQRLACLQRESEELQRERIAAEGRGRGELGGLRKALRRFAQPTLSAVSRAIGSSGSGDCASTPAESLFQNRIDDLQRTADELRAEIFRMAQSEAALRNTADERRKALRRLLLRGATAALRNTIQCGPFQVPASVEAERAALRTAVEEQLMWNLQLSERATSSSAQGDAAVDSMRTGS